MSVLWPDKRCAVKAYNIDGDLVCWNGCQDSIDQGTLPAHIDISTLLGIDDCVKYAWTTDGERRWQPLGWQPAAIIHSNGSVGMPNEEVGAYGKTVTVLRTSPGPLACPPTPTEPDLVSISTPPTPPMRD